MSRQLYSVLGVVLAIASVAQVARAQDGGTKVGYVNIATVTSQMKEAKDLFQKSNDRAQSLQQQLNAKKAELGAIDEARKQFKPESQQYQDKNNEFNRKSIELEVWARTNQADLQHESKQQLKTVYDKVRAAIGEVAKQRGIDIVVSDEMGDVPQQTVDNAQLTKEQLIVALSQRHVLYASPKSDITNEVIAYLDKNYQAPAGGAAPAPAGK